MVEQILLKQCNLFDGKQDDFQKNIDIIIVGNKIKETGRDLIAQTTDGIFFDCSELYIIPGLWECHAHMGYRTRERDGSVKDTLEDFLIKGITSVRDVGGPLMALSKMKQLIDCGEIKGPDLYFAGPMLERSPLHWQIFNETMPGFTVPINTENDARVIVEKIKKQGGSLVKVFNKFDRDVFMALLQEAEKHSLPVTVDPGMPLFHSIPMDFGLEAGIRCFEHAKSPWPLVLIDTLKQEHDNLFKTHKTNTEVMSFMDKVFDRGTDSVDIHKLNRLLDKMLDVNAFLCPTLDVLIQKEIHDFDEVDPEKIERQQRALAIMADVSKMFIERMIGKGIRLLIGQDDATADLTFKEMITLKKCGLSEVEILKGATYYPAQWIGLDDIVGTIEAGKKADVLMLSDNPLEDIQNITTIQTVIKNGSIVGHC